MACVLLRCRCWSSSNVAHNYCEMYFTIWDLPVSMKDIMWFLPCRRYFCPRKLCSRYCGSWGELYSWTFEPSSSFISAVLFHVFYKGIRSVRGRARFSLFVLAVFVRLIMYSLMSTGYGDVLKYKVTANSVFVLFEQWKHWIELHPQSVTCWPVMSYISFVGRKYITVVE